MGDVICHSRSIWILMMDLAKNLSSPALVPLVTLCSSVGGVSQQKGTSSSVNPEGHLDYSHANSMPGRYAACRIRARSIAQSSLSIFGKNFWRESGGSCREVLGEFTQVSIWCKCVPVSNADGIYSKQHCCRLQAETDPSLDSGGIGRLAESLMSQLLSKEILYQPMKDIGERYPAWLNAHR